MVNAPRKLEYLGKFRKTDITFPIELSCLSFKDTTRQKLTRIVDKHWGHPLPIWYALSSSHDLSKAIDNLAQREETNVDNIFYIRKIRSIELLNNTEQLILENNQPLKSDDSLWCINKAGAQQLPKKNIIRLVKWAHEKNLDAAIWTGLGMVDEYSRAKLLSLLKNNNNTLQNTKKYILNSPDLNELTQFEQNILADDLD